MTMDCERCRDGMARRVTGLLSPSEEEELSRHLADCEGCRGESARLKKLVAVLSAFPEEDWSEAPRKVRVRGPLWMPIAAAVLMAVGMTIAAPLMGPRPRLEGEFTRGADGTWTAGGASSAVEIAGHRCVCRRDTRIRLAGPKELVLEEGRLEVSGSGREFRVGTPLGPVDVLGTDFVVEVKTVKKGSIAGGVVVGILVSSGVVSYADLRLERNQAAVAETGKPARRVDARALDDRLRAVQGNARDLERKLAALEFEKSRLAGDLAAAQSGKPPAAAVKLTPADRRERYRRVARMFVRQNSPVKVEVDPEPKEGRQEVIVTREQEADAVVISEALMAANDLGVSIFTIAGTLVQPEFAEAVLLEMLGGDEAVHRAPAEAAVRQAYGSINPSYEYAFERNLAAIQAFTKAIDQLGAGLPPERAGKLYDGAAYLIGSAAISSLQPSPGTETSPEAIARNFADALGKAIGVDEAQAAVLRSTVTEWYPSAVRHALPEKPTSRELIQSMVLARERQVELARRLATAMPDKKDRIEKLFSW